MEFPYTLVTDFPKHQIRKRLLPWIRVGIFNPQEPSQVIYPLGLIDSGADVTIIDRELGEEVGIDIEKGKKQAIKGVGGGTIHGYLHEVGFTLTNPDNSKRGY